LQGFNKTQGQINARVSGTIATGQVAFGTAANTVGGSADFVFASSQLTINRATGNSRLNLQEAGVTIASLQAFSGAARLLNSGSGSIELFTNGVSRINVFPNGNVGINSTTDAGFRLDVNGTARVQGVLTATADAVVNGVSVGRGGGAITTNTRVGTSALNANTTGTNNTAFGSNSLQATTTGFGNTAVGESAGFSITTGGSNALFGRNSGASLTTGTLNSFFGTFSGTNITTGSSNVFVGFNAGRFIADGVTANTFSSSSIFIGTDTRPNADSQGNQIVIGHTAIGLGSNTTVIGNTSTTFGRWFGNLLVGSSTNSGQQLQVTGTSLLNGLSTIQGTTASDSGQLGTELLTTGTGDASWTGTSFATGYTHVAGSTTTLTSTLAGVVNTFYQITYTVTGRTAGSFTIGFGGFTSGNLTATGALGPQATTTGTLVITPTTDFNGTIVLSIRTISASSASVTFNNSSGTITNQIRISSINTNTFIGLNSGRNNTTGAANSFFGSNAGQANTTGESNTAIGRQSLFTNTTGGFNIAIGINSLFNNTTGSTNTAVGSFTGKDNTTGASNSFFGHNSGQANTTGAVNSFFGTNSGLANTTGSSNSFFGQSSGQANTTGASNSFFGENSGFSNSNASSNSFFGHNSGFSNTTGQNNIGVGRNAGRFAGSGTTPMTSVNNSIYLGFQTRGLNATGSTNEVVIGYDVVGLGSNTTVLGNASTTFGRWYGSLLLGTTTNAASSILTMESTTQGFLPPRMTTTQKNAIASPATGLVVYDNTLNKLSVFTGLVWETVTSL
jgi:hypothetical protein